MYYKTDGIFLYLILKIILRQVPVIPGDDSEISLFDKSPHPISVAYHCRVETVATFSLWYSDIFHEIESSPLPWLFCLGSRSSFLGESSALRLNVCYHIPKVMQIYKFILGRKHMPLEL